ncbi:MAG: universal stress protein [Balneolaceae bacterium]|nr:universal stress protein [Balneolaceae bacterium]
MNILEEAKAREAGLIVMGTKGATSSRKLLFGSITTEIILNSDVPVLAIPQDSSLKHFKEISFTTDFHERDLGSLSQIVELGKLFNSNIRVLHVAEEKSLATEIKFRGFRELVREQFPEAPITFQMLMDDDFFVGIAEFLAGHPTHLLVMTRYKKNFWQKMLTRNHSKEMGFYTNVPLLTLVGDSIAPFEMPSRSKKKLKNNSYVSFALPVKVPAADRSATR